MFGSNIDDSRLYEDLFLILSTLPGYFIIGGDFNCTLTPSMDRSTGVDNHGITVE